MFALEAIAELYQHMEWADSQVWGAVTRSPSASDDSELRSRLYHVHLTQRGFLQLWTGQKLERYDPNRFSTTVDLLAWVRDYYREIPTYLSGVDDGLLAGKFLVPWARMYEKQLGRPADAVTLAETLFQVTAHSNYHRGQINTRLRQIGVDPPMVDYIAWLWTGRPAAEW